MTRFAWGLATDTGRVRPGNQDSALAIEGLFAVADGMGGHRGGEVASEVAVTALREQAPLLTTNDLLEAMHAANDAIVTRSAHDPALRGMGTTLCVLALVDAEGQARLAVANVGDSRVYLFAHSELEQMTDDHSLVAALVREGRLTPEEAEAHPQRNILTRALGIDTDVLIDAWEVLPVVGDRWVLCSDGLFNEVTEDQIAAVLRRLADPIDAARELVRLANEGGGRDNITVLVVDVVDEPGHAAADETSLVAAPAPGARRDPTDLAGFGSAPGGDARPAATLVEERRDGDARAGAAPASPKARHARPRRFTWRVAVFLVALVGIFAVACGAVVYYARHTWYVDLTSDRSSAVIYQGRRGGVLWFHPTEVTRHPVIGTLTPAQLEALKQHVQLGSEQAAENYVRDNAVAPTTSVPATTLPPATALPSVTTVPAPTTTVSGP